MNPLRAGDIRAELTARDVLRNLYNRFFSGDVEYQLFIDIWEGQGTIDWSLVEAQAAAIRINDISGGTHSDQMFEKHWNDCPILKVPYFVYNPWNTGKENYDWLKANMPADSKSVLLDIEVIKSGYPPNVYAIEVSKFHALCNLEWNCAIYTAQWFLPYISYWPDEAQYWWAQWPWQFYPSQVELWTWKRVADEMEARGNPYPSNMSAIPGELKFWQFSGDRLIVPGSTKVMDLNLFYGSYQDLSDWIGSGEIIDPPDPPSGGSMRTFTNGVTEEVWTEFDQEIHVLTIPPAAIDLASFYYTPGDGHLAEELVNTPYKIFFNFTPYDFGPLKVNIGLRIDGTQYEPYVNYNPWLEWTSDKRASIDHVASQWKYRVTASQGWRYIFQDGAKAATSAAWDQRVARRIVANDQEGKTIILTSTGDRPEGGLTLHEVADIFSRWVADGHGNPGIFDALDGDSGHSAQVAYMTDDEMQLFSGPEPTNRNHPPAWGYIKLKTPLITDGTTPPDPGPEEPEVDVLSLTFDATTKTGTLVYTVDGEERTKDF